MVLKRKWVTGWYVIHDCADAKFTKRQKMYDVQVASHEAAVAALRPGVPFVDVYEKALCVIWDGMKNLGFAKGDSMEAVKAGACAMFMPCGLGYMMGLDVHDMENLVRFMSDGTAFQRAHSSVASHCVLGRPLEPGFCLTIEPGIYFIPELMDLWKSEHKFTDFLNYDKLATYKDFSASATKRIILITETGSLVSLGKKVPIHTEDVEAEKTSKHWL